MRRPDTGRRSALASASFLRVRAVTRSIDPVMIATSGATLADADTIAAFERLMRLAALTTPNVPELAALGGDWRGLHRCVDRT